MLANIVVLAIGNERKVDVAEVVVDGTTASAASHDMTAFVKKHLDIALGIRVLVVTDDDGLLVFPKIHRDGVFFLVVDEICFDRAVQKRVVLCADDDLQFWHNAIGLNEKSPLFSELCSLSGI